jgi:transcription elongation factor Elf1
MDLETSLNIINRYEKCLKCGDFTVGNGSKLYIGDNDFERTCRECGWKVKGHINEYGEVVETFNNII